MIEGVNAPGLSGAEAINAAPWKELLPETKLEMHTSHVFVGDRLKNASNEITHVRLNIYPDGGVARLRVFGTPAEVR